MATSLAEKRTVVLQAPPGSDKTTRAAPFLMNAPQLKGRKILLLEPRCALRPDLRLIVMSATLNPDASKKAHPSPKNSA